MSISAKEIKDRHAAAKEAFADFARGYGSVYFCTLCHVEWPCDAYKAATIAYEFKKEKECPPKKSAE